LVNTSLTNLVVNGTTLREDTSNDTTATAAISYGVGQAYITISPFDNYYKFTFFQKANDGTTKNIDLSSSGEYSMVFINNQNKKVSAPSIVDNNIAKPAKGELAFKIDETLATQILQFTNKKFYISNRPRVEANTGNTNSKVSRLSNVSAKLAARSVSLNDSITELRAESIKASEQNTSVKMDTARISSKSSSVLYWGNWISEDETAPQTTVVADTGLSSISATSANTPASTSIQREITGKSSWQKFGSISVNSQANTSSQGTSGTSNSNLSNLSPAQLRNAIASDVQGKMELGWSTPDILSYFLDPSGTGYKLYGGISKEVFEQAVTGIFSRADLSLLLNYGNTSSGRTNGGSGSQKGSNKNQTGSDNGSPNSGPQFPTDPS